MNRLTEWLLDLLYPPKCAFCRKLVRDGRMLCPECERKLPWAKPEESALCIPHLALCLSPLYYTGDVRKSLLRYKFHGAAAYCRIYGELMADCLKQSNVQPDVVTWVPLSRQRLRKRGYDQARLLAEEVAKRLSLPCECMIEKTKHNPAHSGTGGPEARKRNVEGVYRAVTDCTGVHVLLVDDIVTTGATLSAAAGMLIAAGAAEVTGLTLARASWEQGI